MKTDSNLISVTLMVAGTTIGGGILALPLIAGEAGFLPSVCVCLLAWLMMAASGWLMADEYLDANGKNALGVLYQKALGPLGKHLFVLLYFGLFGCLLTAYLSGITGVFAASTGLPSRIMVLLVWSVLAVLVFGGIRRLFAGNNFLVLLMLLAFFILLFSCLRHVVLERFQTTNWTFFTRLFPVFLGSFGFHGSIPVFCQQLKGHRPSVFKAIFGGTSIACLLYLLFLSGTLGCLPQKGEIASIEFALKNDLPVTIALGQLFGRQHFFNFLGNLISVLAIVTSFFGVAEGFAQFLHDECSKISVQRGRYLALAFPLLGFFLGQNVFIRGLIWMGVGCGVLFGIIPSWIWIKRFWGRWQVWVGFALLFAFIGALSVEIKGVFLKFIN